MALEAIYMVSTATTKISILLFYRRLAAGSVTKNFIYCVHAAIAFVVAYFVVFWINLFIGCRPLAAYWSQIDPFWEAQNEYQCIDEARNLLAASGISVLQDFIACGLPTILLWKVQFPRRQKIALGIIFGVGFLYDTPIIQLSTFARRTDKLDSLCVAGVLRIIYTIPLYYSTYDVTWESYPAWIWYAIESHMAVICASAPALKLFFKETLQVSDSSRSKRKTDKYELSAGSTVPTSGKESWFKPASVDNEDHDLVSTTDLEHHDLVFTKDLEALDTQQTFFVEDDTSSNGG